MGDSKTCPALMVCVYVDDKKLQEKFVVLSPERRWYDYGLGKVINQILIKIINQKLIEEGAGEDCEAI